MPDETFADSLIRCDRCAKGENGKLHNFETLNPARNADECDAVGNADGQISKRHFPTADQDPENIRDRV